MRGRAILLLVAMGAALVAGSGAVLAADIICDTNPCLGTSDPDIILGTTNADTIKARAGNDLVDAHTGKDTIYGGPNGDGSAVSTAFSVRNLEGAEGSDTVYGGGGADFIDAAASDTPGSVDRSYGEKGNDQINAVDGNEDKIYCGSGENDVANIDAGIDSVVRGCETKNEFF